MDPGAFSKKLNNNSTPAILRHDHEACNTSQLVYYTIKNDKMLMLLDKRYYYDGHGNLKKLSWKNDKNLIGKTIGFRSPATCASKEGICHICYGDLFDMNSDLFSIGSFAATKESEPYGQKILSSKHSQITSSNVISLCKDFYKLFDLSSNEITLNQEFEDDAYLQFEDVEREDTGDEEFYSIGSINVLDGKNNALFKIYDENGTRFYLSTEMIKTFKKFGEKPIPISEFEDDSTILFQVEIKNLELSKPLDDIEKLLNNNEHLGCKTISEICQKMLELKIAAGINYNAVHHEVIISQLLRKKSNIYERPDFTLNGDPEDYQILRLDKALFTSPSPVTSLVSSYLRKQLLSPDLYEKKESSHYDPFFLDNVSGIKNE